MPSTYDGPPLPDTMSAAEFKARREALGLSVPWLSKRLRVDERTIRSWESGKYTVPDGVRDTLLRFKDNADTLVEEILAELDAGAEHPIVQTLRAEDDYQWADDRNVDSPGRVVSEVYPSSWHRAVAVRVAERVPGARIVYFGNLDIADVELLRVTEMDEFDDADVGKLALLVKGEHVKFVSDVREAGDWVSRRFGKPIIMTEVGHGHWRVA